MLRVSIVRISLVLAVTVVAACGRVQVTPDSPPVSDASTDAEGAVTEYAFEPMVFRASEDESGELVANATDLPNLFAEANDYLRADDYANALELYELILDTFDDEEYRRVSMYNAGLSYEGLGRWEEAAEMYAGVIERWRATEDATYAFYRLAECFARLGQYERVPALMDEVLPRFELDVGDRDEAQLRWGEALLELRRFAEADQHLRAALAINRDASERFDPLEPDESLRPLPRHHALIARAHFHRARVYHELFSEIRLVLPQERLTEDLVDKTQLFEQAQDSYLDSVRSGHAYWSPAAGYMVAQLFEDYYFDVLATEIPDDFGELELEIYWEELRAFIRPAMERALNIYEHNLAMAYRLGAEGVWVDDTLASIERVRTYLFDQEGWEEEQRLVEERRHPRSAFFAGDMQFRDEVQRSGYERAYASDDERQDADR